MLGNKIDLQLYKITINKKSPPKLEGFLKREPEGIRTPNRYGRNVVHYPIMLRVHLRLQNYNLLLNLLIIIENYF